MPEPRILIDAAVPRTKIQRCQVLFDYLTEISDVKPHEVNDPGWLEKQLHYGPDAWFWTEHEDALINLVNEKLPHDMICMLHPDNPGDVIVVQREEG